jgi:hypothetical protein
MAPSARAVFLCLALVVVLLAVSAPFVDAGMQCLPIDPRYLQEQVNSSQNQLMRIGLVCSMPS